LEVAPSGPQAVALLHVVTGVVMPWQCVARLDEAAVQSPQAAHAYVCPSLVR
jgi:hypothetical protein